MSSIQSASAVTSNKNVSKYSLRQQIIISFCCGIALLIVVSMFLLATITKHNLTEHAKKQGTTIVENLAEESALAFLYDSEEIAKETSKAALAFPSVEQIVLYQTNRKIFYQSSEAVQPAVSYGLELSIVESDASLFFFLPVFAAVEDAEEDSPFAAQAESAEVLGYVGVTLSKDALQTMAIKMYWGNGLVIGSVSLGMLLVIFMILHRVTKPLQNLIGVMHKAQEGERGVRAQPEGPADIVVMENAFNQMIAEIEEREAELIEARDAALESARIKSIFAATVSHELRTPMNGVLGMLQLIEQHDVPTDVQGLVSTAINSANDLLHLIQDVLDFSKFESGKVTIEPDTVAIRDMCDDIVELLAFQARQKTLLLVNVVEGDVPDDIEVDIARLRQVLVNIIGNAIKFTHEGYISLHIRRIMLPSDDAGHPGLSFEVTDTGIGIAPEAQIRIFDSFVQADGSTTRAYGGTGLGLTISKQLVELMGGELRVSSEEGKGTCFQFRLPLIERGELVEGAEGTEGSEKSTAASVGEQTQQRTVTAALLVSDETDRCTVLTEALESWHIDVTAVAQLAKAQALLSEAESANTQKFDCILVDIKELAETDLSIFSEYLQAAEGRVVCLSEAESTLAELQPLMRFLPRYTDSLSIRRHLFPPSYISEENALVLGGASEAGRNTCCALVVDDNRTNQIVASGMLERLGVQVELASNGAKALEVLANNPRIDIVFMDCHMPAMDGYETTENYRNAAQTRPNLPIISMTAHVSSEDRQRCKESGMDDYLSKPLVLGELSAKLRLWVPNFANLSANADDTDGNGASDLAVEHPADVQFSVFNGTTQNLFQERPGAEYMPLLRAFATDLEVYLKQLTDCVEKNDSKQFDILSRKLVGCAINVGAEKIIELANELCGAERINQDETIVAVISALKAEQSRVQAEIEEIDNIVAHKQECACDNRARVMIVDDDQSARYISKMTLGPLDVDIIEADDGLRAIDLAAQFEPDIILMDAMMPMVDGFEATRRILRQARKNPPSIMVMTALHDDKSIHKAFEMGATDFMMKPIHLTLLRRRVAYLLQARKAQQQVKQLTFSDPLTCLPNRSRFMDQLNDEVRWATQKQSEFALISLNVDKLAMVNDLSGHRAGDNMIKQMSERLMQCIPDVDFLARTAGTEFTVIHKAATSEESLEGLLRDIVAALEAPLLIEGREYSLGVNLGVACFPEHGSDVQALVQHANGARTESKIIGGNMVMVYGSEQMAAADQHRCEDLALYASVNAHEFTMVFEPRIALDDESLIGLEAWICWMHPNRGQLRFHDFRRIAESNRLVEGIGLHLAQMTLTQLDTWRAAGTVPPMLVLPITVSMLAPRVVEALIGVTKECQHMDLPVCFQLVDLVPSDLNDFKVAMLERLGKAGGSFEVSYFDHQIMFPSEVMQLPFTTIVVGNDFLSSLPSEHYQETLISQVIEVAHHVGIRVCVRDVCSRGQIDLLANLHCDAAQGRVYGEPLVADVADGEMYNSAKRA